MPVRVRMSIMLWCYKIEMRGLLRATLMGPSGYPAELAAAVDLSLIMNQQRRTLRTSSPVRVTHGAQPTGTSTSAHQMGSESQLTFNGQQLAASMRSCRPHKSQEPTDRHPQTPWNYDSIAGGEGVWRAVRWEGRGSLTPVLGAQLRQALIEMPIFVSPPPPPPPPPPLPPATLG